MGDWGEEGAAGAWATVAEGKGAAVREALGWAVAGREALGWAEAEREAGDAAVGAAAGLGTDVVAACHEWG